jgi:hypothetical protein
MAALVSLFSSSVPSRRLTSRLPATSDVWVYWECSGFSDLSHVRDLSTGGIFIETRRRKAKGDLVHLHFLAPEGQISVDGVVAHEESITGIGLKFQTVAAKDIPKLTALFERLRSASPVD